MQDLGPRIARAVAGRGNVTLQKVVLAVGVLGLLFVVVTP